jgi:light-regulated signal transduction histidine kinase (bacteriophytochrome)
VDDEPATLATLTTYLSDYKYQILVAQTGEAGLDISHRTPPDLILLDVRLPGIDGFEVCKRLKADIRTREIPVIFMTIMTGAEDKVRGFEAGGVDYITKPFQHQEVLARVVTHLRISGLTRQLEASNRELEMFAYSVSHDLRSPLRHIGGFLKLLNEHIGESIDTKSQHYIDTVVDVTRRLGMLIDDLLSFSRMGRADIVKLPVDLAGEVQEVIRDLEPETRDRDIHWQIAELPEVSGDRAMLHIVLVNLLENAVKFTRTRKKAEIEIGCKPQPDQGEVVVFVRDNGVGFEMQYSDKLFGVFQRLHHIHEFEGTGIGLANVRRIINRHGGRTWGKGKINQGATFYFALPQESVCL